MARTPSAWRRRRHAGRHQRVAELKRAAQRVRLATGEVVRPLHSVTLADDAKVFSGDEVQTRQAERSLTTDAGVSVKNRHRWVVDEISVDGSITVSDEERGRVTLPRGYVADSLTLAYASTAMAAQGRTVDHSLVLVDGPIDVAGVYVPELGRDGNDGPGRRPRLELRGARRGARRRDAPAVGRLSRDRTLGGSRSRAGLTR